MYPQKLIMKWKYKHCNELLVNWWNPVMWSITFHSSKNTHGFSRINFNISLSNPFIIHVGRLSFYQLPSECSIGISCIYSYGADLMYICKCFTYVIGISFQYTTWILSSETKRKSISFLYKFLYIGCAYVWLKFININSIDFFAHPIMVR